MARAVIKGASYILAQAPDILKHYGSTQSTTREKNPEDPYLKELPAHLRSFDDAVNYPPNQVYIGNMTPAALESLPQPWFRNAAKADRFGSFGEIMSQSEFYILMKHADSFDLVFLTRDFSVRAKDLIASHPLLKDKGIDPGEGSEAAAIEKMLDEGIAEGLYEADALVGCVKRAHDLDESLSAHVMLENLAVKASGILAVWHLARQEGIDIAKVDYILECSEEAAGDMNQRGGGNIAKAVGEKSGCLAASGADLRAFCAAPAHAIVNAVALVGSGVFKNVLVVAGGSVPKLGMNGKDHVKKQMPILEDMLGGFALVIGEDDGVNPVVNTKVIGRHAISSGSSPQAVMSALIYDPLAAAGMKIPEVQRYSAELQNHEITAPAGAGNVPEANVKMVGALAVMKGQLEKAALPQFIKDHGVPGFAPTQGHIPSGVPFIGHARRDMLAGSLCNAMIIGKGSLFLGRLTNLFDGLSFLIEANDGQGTAKAGPCGSDEAAVKRVVARAMRDVAQAMLAAEEGL